MEHQPGVQHRAAGHGARGNCTFSLPLLWKGRAGLCSCSTARGKGTKVVKLDGEGTFANKYTSSEIFLKGHIDRITYKLRVSSEGVHAHSPLKDPQCYSQLQCCLVQGNIHDHCTWTLFSPYGFSLAFGFFSFKWQLLLNLLFLAFHFFFFSLLLSFWLGICWHWAVKPLHGAN